MSNVYLVLEEWALVTNLVITRLIFFYDCSVVSLLRF